MCTMVRVRLLLFGAILGTLSCASAEGLHCPKPSFKTGKAIASTSQGKAIASLAIDQVLSTNFISEEGDKSPWLQAELEEERDDKCLHRHQVIGVRVRTRKPKASLLKKIKAYVSPKKIGPNNKKPDSGTLCDKEPLSGAPPDVPGSSERVLEFCCERPIGHEVRSVYVEKELDKNRTDANNVMVVGELEVIHMGDGVCNAWGEVEDGWHDDGKEGKAGDKRDKYADHPRYDKTKFDPKTYTRNVNGVVMTWSQLGLLGIQYANTPDKKWIRPRREVQTLPWTKEQALWFSFACVIILLLCLAANIYLYIEEEKREERKKMQKRRAAYVAAVAAMRSRRGRRDKVMPNEDETSNLRQRVRKD